MMPKYMTIKEDVFQFIHNRIQAGIDPVAVKNEVIERYPIYIAYFDTTPEMLDEFIGQQCEFAYYLIKREYYYESNPKAERAADPGA